MKGSSRQRREPDVVSPSRPSGRAGVTFLQVMIVVALISTLAAVIVPSMVHLSQTSRTNEAMTHLGEIFRASATYYTTQHTPFGATAVDVPHAFPVPAPLTPATVPPGLRVTDPSGTWAAPTWQALGFGLTEPHYFSYMYDSSGSEAEALFTARALGDLDGNGVFSTYERAGGVDAQLHPTGSRGLWINHPVE